MSIQFEGPIYVAYTVMIIQIITHILSCYILKYHRGRNLFLPVKVLFSVEQFSFFISYFSFFVPSPPPPPFSLCFHRSLLSLCPSWSSPSFQSNPSSHLVPHPHASLPQSPYSYLVPLAPPLSSNIIWSLTLTLPFHRVPIPT